MNAQDVTFSQNAGEDLVVTLANGETVTVTDHFDNTQEDMERIEFADGTVLDLQGIAAKLINDQNGAGDDLVLGSIGADTFYGGLGNDTLKGGDGADTYIYTSGDGNDVIHDFSYQNVNDRLVFADVNAADVIFSQNAGEDLVVTLANGETVTVTDHFDNTQEDMELIEFADGTVLDLQGIAAKLINDQNGAGDDLVLGSIGADTFYGGLGNDTLKGGDGADTYIYTSGDGNDVIHDFSYQNVNDRLVFADVNAQDVTFSQNGGEDLVVTLANGETVTVTDHFDNTQEDMELIEFADGTVLDLQGIAAKLINDQNGVGDDLVLGSIGADTFYGGLGNDTLKGGDGADTYIYTSGNGNDVIHDFSYQNVNDRLVFADVNAQDVTFSQNAGEDLVVTLANDETATVTDHFDNTQEDMELIEFADGTVLDAQAIRDKSVADQKASGTVLGSEYTENYSHNLGDGSYTINDFSYQNVNDRLAFADVNAADVTFYQNAGEDLVVTLANGETVTVTDHFDNTQEDMELVEFADGTVLNPTDITDKLVADQSTSGDDNIRTGYLDDTLYGGTGNDILNGGKGADTYFYALGDGDDVINDFSYSSSELDLLIFSDLNVGDMSFGRTTGDDLVISMTAGGSVTVTDHFANSQEDMERIEFADGTVWTQTDILNEYVWL